MSVLTFSFEIITRVVVLFYIGFLLLTDLASYSLFCYEVSVRDGEYFSGVISITSGVLSTLEIDHFVT